MMLGSPKYILIAIAWFIIAYLAYECFSYSPKGMPWLILLAWAISAILILAKFRKKGKK